jgi:myo-inositol catabolism protein IolC
MRELQDAGIEPSGWAFTPPNDMLAAATAAAQAHVDGRSGTLVLFQVGADPDPGRISNGLSRADRAVAKLAARTPGVSGVLIGPDAFFATLVRLHQKVVTREDAVTAIAGHFKKLWEVHAEARKTSDVI